MLVPLSWLREFAPFGADVAALAATFNDLGMVVEGVEHVGEGLDGVVVAKVLEVGRIEGADKIRRVVVEDGSGSGVQVVCGAWNFDAGATVAFARVGAVLPGGFEIGRRKMRGVESNGMICSAAELRLGADAEGIVVLADDHDAGTPLADALGIEADVVFDLAIETNRPDAMSMAGVARDAAARLKLPFAIPTPAVDATGPDAGTVTSVRVDAPGLCPRFTAHVATGVVVGPSPKWVQRRLTLAGMRPINNVVDASNYVMLELGQPTHPYDLDLLPGAGLTVRAGRAGEVVRTLDGVDRVVGDEDCLICDAEGAPVGIGGIMGGESSEIGDATTRVLLEAAYFTPMAIARTSKRLGLRSEASARFERGCDPEGIERAARRFFEVLGGGTVASGLVDVRSLPAERPSFRVRTARVNTLLGTDLATGQIAQYLEPIGFVVTPAADGTGIDVVPPSFRPDVSGEVHVVEEVARHHGYGSIARTVPRSPFVGQLTPYQAARRRMREVLVGAGVDEAIGAPLLGPGDAARSGLDEHAIEAVDPLAREESRLRTSLLPGLLRSVAFNASHRTPDACLFEIGHVFLVPADRSVPLPDERERLGVVLAGADAAVAKRLLDLVAGAFHLAVALEPAEEAGLHPTRTAAVLLGGEVVGHVGEVDPGVLAAWGIESRVGWVGLELERFLPERRAYVQARAVSRFPSSDVDLAFAVPDEVAAAAVAATIREAAGDLLGSLHLFDVYRGAGVPEGARSLAFRLRLQAGDRTLTDEDIAVARRRCIDAVESAHRAGLRG